MNSGMDVFARISLCSGYDGIGLGLKRAVPNIRTVCYVEREAYACANLVAKIKEGKLDDAPIWDDVSTFDSRPFAGLVDIIDAGVPCQPWSVAGKRKGTKDDRWIWDDIFRIIVEVQPSYVFLEEVPGFVSGGGLGFVLSDLAKAGFDAEWSCFTASEVGAPHKRQRLFILGRLGNTESLYNRRINGYNLADSNGSGCQEQCGAESIRQEYIPIECSRWPARPGQPQYEWEEPRVVLGHRKTGQESMADTENGRRSGTINKRDESENAGQGKDERCNVVEPLTSKSEGQAEPCVGRAVNGPSRRVDRLRLLGNGVVPQCAEKAIRTLGALFE